MWRSATTPDDLVPFDVQWAEVAAAMLPSARIAERGDEPVCRKRKTAVWTRNIP
ncbi:hypothetical protein [Streptomyces erythrochromogenes]|uniref:hypothetical protein n=1 Tax=Streptomyces erythrochromogenes TaxID=285574 RepID=UPI00369040BA